MIVVSNATPLIFLGKLNAVHLLQTLYQMVLISPKVYAEAIVAGLKYGHADAIVLNLYYQKNILTMQPLADQALSVQLQNEEGLDAGEAETIGLALAHRAELTLIDEQRARQIARRKGLVVKGTLGVIFDAFRQGTLTPMQAEFYIRQIMQQDDIWISSVLCEQVLAKIQQP